MLLQIFSWFWQWKNFENRLIFDKVKGFNETAIFWPTLYIHQHLKFVNITQIACGWTQPGHPSWIWSEYEYDGHQSPQPLDAKKWRALRDNGNGQKFSEMHRQCWMNASITTLSLFVNTATTVLSTTDRTSVLRDKNFMRILYCEALYWQFYFLAFIHCITAFCLLFY